MNDRDNAPGSTAPHMALAANFFKVALRSVRRRPGYAAINILGLAVGMACCLVILLHVRSELSFDRFHADAERMYRVNWDFRWNGQEGVGPGTPPPLARRLVDELPGVDEATRLYPVTRTTVRRGDAAFNEEGIVAADPDFFAFWDYNLVEGNPATALEKPNSVVLTQETAWKYFGDRSPLGEIVEIGEPKQVLGAAYDDAFRVTGIVETPPENSHIRFDMLTSIASHPEVAFFDWSWIWMQVTTYVKLQGDPAAIERQIPTLVQKYAPDAFERVGFSYEEMIAGGGRWDFVLQPLYDVYLGDVGNRLGPTGNRTYVYVFLTIALFVVLIACINFMNLATARSASRAREVGVRKALGSPRRVLVGQFLVESVTFSLLALPLAVGLVFASVHPFEALTGSTLVVDLFESLWMPAALVGITIAVGIVAGSYPGLFLSRFRPAQVLKGTIRAGGDRRLRHGLVVFQFSMTIALIACTLLVHRQMAFIREADLGFEREGVVVISNQNHPLGESEEAFKAQLERHPDIRSVSFSTGLPPEFGFEDYYEIEGAGESALISYMTDADFIETIGIDLIEGRNFADAGRDESRSVILNETAVRAFGWEDPLGKSIHYPSRGTYRVVGVVEDFNFLDLRQPIVPFALFHESSGSYEIADSYAIVRVDRDELAGSLEAIREEWAAFVPATPIEHTFLDDRFAAEYESDRRLGRMFTVFSILTIFIACLGLLGLAAYTAEQRVKEIGIRKVLGASVGSIVMLLSRDFTRLVLVAALIATPVAYLAMRHWLQDFAYHAGVSGWVFVVAAAAALIVALGTVSLLAIRAAVADPVRSLRYE